MARIAGVDLPRDKRIIIALTYIYGIGVTSAQKILTACDIDPNIRTKDLTDDQTARIRQEIQANYRVEGTLRTEVQMQIKRLMDIGSYRGLRHRRGLPARGQRTKTNSRTKKGRRKTIGAKRKK